jgi:hypothetical protein
MVLSPQPLPPVPQETGRVARAAFPRGHPCLGLADELDAPFTDDSFAALFPRRGRPALAPWRLVLATILHFAEGLSNRQAADAVRARLLRVGLYYRRSSEMQADNFSLDAQLRACHDFCRQRGWTIGGEYTDDGKSGRTADLAKRPAFAAMLADAEAGACDVIAVHKLDRFARNVIVTMTTLELLNACDVGFVSISLRRPG